MLEVLQKRHNLKKIDVLPVPTSIESIGKPALKNKRKRSELVDDSIGLTVSKTEMEMKGHTSYLVFAVLLPGS